MSPAHCLGAETSECSCFSRRELLRTSALAGGSVAAAALLAGCGSSEEPSAGTGDDAADASGGGALGAASEVPVGSAVIFADQQVVVAQPKAGEYVAFSATCTHQGCQVSEVAEAEIVCTCHGSRFSIEDGSVISGPATEPLASEEVSVESDQLVLG